MSDDEPDDPQTVDDEGADATGEGELPAEEKRKRTRIEVEKTEAERFWRGIFATPIGRREMWRLLSAAGTFETPFAISPSGFPDPQAAWFRAGQYEYGQRLTLSWQILDPRGYLTMLLENDPRFAKHVPPKRRRKRE